jgi:N-acyl-D-amino-acid deacylase
VTVDLLIRGALVHDGLGNPPVPLDVAISHGRIARLAPRIDEPATETIGAAGLSLCPGFIDMHSHSDEAYLIDPHADAKIRQGVTTEVIGNCGMSAAPLGGVQLDETVSYFERYGVDVDWRTFGEYVARLESTGLANNCVALVGHGNLRRIAVGTSDSRASDKQLEHMKALLREALEAGAWGYSTGLIYVPSCFADIEELSELAKVSRETGGLYASHIRNEGDTLIEAVAEAIEIGRRAGCRVEISHHKASGRGNWGKIQRTLHMMAQAREEGVEVFCDQYPYTASSTYLSAVLPLWAVEGGNEALLARLNDAAQRARMRDAIRNHPYGDWTKVQIASIGRPDGPNAHAVGLHAQALGERRGQEPEDAVLDLLVEERAKVSAIYFSMCDADVERVMTDPHTTIGSDAGARAVSGPLSTGQPHPRAFGTFPRVLGYYCRERKLLPLEVGIARMTGLPAKRLGLHDRGVIREGAWADVVLFDADKIADRATFDKPQQYPDGVAWVLVNGVPVVENGQPGGRLPGQVLRRRTAG